MLTTKSDEKRELILMNAKKVFIKKGFAAVTMKDIIEECSISRGGIYLYFKSVDEIFMQVITMHNKQKLKEARDYLSTGKSFAIVLDEYFYKQKKRLLSISSSLLIAMYEYRFAHKEDFDKEFFYKQFVNTKNIVLEMLNYGVAKGEISGRNIDELAMNVMFFIEGLSMLGTAAEVSEEIIDKQINFIKQVIFAH